MFLYLMATPERSEPGSGFVDPLPLPKRRRGVSLFWRTFFLQSLLLVGCVVAWTETLHEMEFEPRALQTARQVASVVNLSRAAVMHTDAIDRVSLFKTMKDQEHVTILPREPKDTYEPNEEDEINKHITQEIKSRLGHDSVVAKSVNGVEGLWIGFSIDKDQYWLKTDRSRFDEATRSTWVIWLLTAALLSLAGAAWIARLINLPLKNLAFAAKRVRTGDFEASSLDETVSTHEIRAVNVGFNRMTQKLAKIEQDRAVMLAGISHDLRTPLARLRLETELSVDDEQARELMVSDIAQIDAIIGKFLDYARPGGIERCGRYRSTMRWTSGCALAQAQRHTVSGGPARPIAGAGRPGGVDAGDRQPAGKRRALWQIKKQWRRHGGHFSPLPKQKGDSAHPRPWSGRASRPARKADDAVFPRRQWTHSHQQHRPGAGHCGTNSGAYGWCLELSNASSGGLCANLLLKRANGESA